MPSCDLQVLFSKMGVLFIFYSVSIKQRGTIGLKKGVYRQIQHLRYRNGNEAHGN